LGSSSRVLSLRKLSLRTRLGVLAFAALIAGCPTGEDAGGGSEADGGTPETEGGAPVENEAGATVEAAAKDAVADQEAAAPPPPCGRLTTICADGEKCAGAPDCASKVCFGGLCKPVAPADGTKNGDETDVDCGGSKAPACADAKECLIKADCVSGVCTANVCQAPTATDTVQNGDETGTDCGGTTTAAPKCPVGQGCLTNLDCDNIKCDTVQKKCLPASNGDGIKNLDESGVDCGGPTAAVPRCPTGGGCAITSDCANVLCNAGTLVCDPPSATDELKNGTETDVDCGGGGATPACKGGKVCVLNADCMSTTCNYAGKCAHARSCKTHFGGDTCGKGEVGQAGAVHEDCCTSIPLPDNTVRMDKYEITAGRMREFITATGGQVRQWVDLHRPETIGQIPDAMLPYLPEGNEIPVRSITKCDAASQNCVTTNQRFGIYEHLGLTTFMPDRPCANCGQGCWIGAGADQIGHNTYWWPDSLKGKWGTVNRTFDQNTLDVKSLNCTPQLLLAAFCAWDGGRLPTWNELGSNSVNSAWGNQSYPWGTASPNDTLPGAPGRVSYYSGPGVAQGNGYPGDASYFLVRMPSNYADAAQWNTTNFNPNYHPSWPWVRYAWPVIAATTNDTAFLVAAPGRFLNDYRQVGANAGEGYHDVGGNLLEATGDQSATDDANHNGWPRVRWVGGSFEGHGVGRANHNLSVLTKYGKQGARCVRPL
jgi:hypothetical protein